MLEKATTAMRPKAPIDTKAIPATEYSRAASMACRKQHNQLSYSTHSYGNASAGALLSHQPAGECVGLQSVCMPREEHLVLGRVRSDIAEQLEERIARVLWQNALGHGVQV